MECKNFLDQRKYQKGSMRVLEDLEWMEKCVKIEKTTDETEKFSKSFLQLTNQLLKAHSYFQGYIDNVNSASNQISEDIMT